MKLHLKATVIVLAAVVTSATAQTGYTNFIRQTQAVSGIEWDVQVAQTGSDLSPLSVDPGGARFELWTVRNSPLQSYLLDHTYVGTFVPQVTMRVYSEDPYMVIPRTRADRPFNVEITVNGLVLDDPDAPDAARMVIASRYVQSYGADGDGVEIDREEATLQARAVLNQNKTHLFQFALNNVPGSNRAKVRGEERFLVESLDYYEAPASQLATKYIQIWPVADATITGISDGDYLRFYVPQIEIELNDLYPDSETWAHVYSGNPQLGKEGTIIAGSAIVIADSVPQNRVLRIKDWAGVIVADGRWTLEVLTKTPFGVERMAYVWFDIKRTIEMNGTFTTIE